MWGGLVAAAVLVLGVVAAGCVPRVNPPPPPPSVALKISTNPTLFPSFSTSTTDYVSRCAASAPVAVSVKAPVGTKVSVAGQPASSGTFVVKVTRGVGQSFTIEVQKSSGSTTHYVRCLPADFPLWSVHTSGSTQAQWYVTVPVTPTGMNYPVIFDPKGVPMWWAPPSDAGFATLLANNNVVYGNVQGIVGKERRLDGSLVRTITADMHDVRLLPNGDYVTVTFEARSGVDLSGLCVASVCGPSSAAVWDHVIQERAPDGTLVWSWRTSDHIPVSEMDPQWIQQYILDGPSGVAYDVYHWNSIEFTGSGFIVSYRHLDAVYDIDKTTRAVVWKLGGSPRPKSLAVKGDPVFPTSGFGGQHDARLLSDGTVTIFDNGTGRNRPPRAVRYRIDTKARTATLVETRSDPLITSSICCGSARRLSRGNWVIGWGFSNAFTETTPAGTSVFRLEFPTGTFLYRAEPVPSGQLDRATLRAGMDAQYSSSGAAHTTTQPH